MNILLVLIPVTALIVLVAIALFFWAVNQQQFDDLESPASLPLLDDEPPPPGSDDADPDQPPPSADDASLPKPPSG